MLKKILLTGVALVSAVGLAWAANLSFSTGAHFQPTGPALTKGSDLNVMVDAINALQTAVPVTDPMLIGTGVNQVSIASGATNVVPKITVGGASADANIGISISGKGSGAAYMGGTTAANASLRVPTVTSAVNEVEVSGAVATTGIPYVSVGGASADTNAAISLSGKGTGATLLGGKTTTLAGLQIAQTASRVNDFVLTPTATGSAPILEAGGAGSDAAVGAVFGTAGTGAVSIDTDASVVQFQVGRTASAVDYLVCKGAATADPALVTCTATGSDSNININLTSKGAGNVKLGVAAASTCSGTTTATCQGQRFVVSVTGLTTAASTLSAAMTVTDANVVSSSSQVMCQPQGYAGTGVPIVVNVTPGTGSVAFNIQNVSTGAALNATVAVACVVFGT